MNGELKQRLEAVLDCPGKVIDLRPISGGCISRAYRVALADGTRLFVKTHPTAPPGMFEREAEGLEALAAANALRVPRTIAVGDAQRGTSLLVLEQIDPGEPGNDFSEQLGRGLARLHQQTQGERYGFDHDNYLGSTPQPNAWDDDWARFFAEKRLGHQLNLARDNGLCERQMADLGERVIDRLDPLIGSPQDPPCLLHGDLWGET
jgi:protein-ribulosamine 3-kinase